MFVGLSTMLIGLSGKAGRPPPATSGPSGLRLGRTGVPALDLCLAYDSRRPLAGAGSALAPRSEPIVSFSEPKSLMISVSIAVCAAS